LVAQTATSDWDLVLVPKSVFTGITVSPERQAAHPEAATDAMRAAADSGSDTSFKRMQQAIKDQETRITKLTEAGRKDTGLNFEESGCDYLLVDFTSRTTGRTGGGLRRWPSWRAPPGSQQAEDLVMKLDVLREKRRDEAAAAGREMTPGEERVATFSTGTPVANSLGEMWVMQSYLRPDLLADAGVADVDAWGAVFTGTTASVEMNASGSRLAPVTRVGRFVNVPELVTMSSVYTDVVTREDITVALPELVGGARQVISKPASQEVRDFISDLAYRSEHFDPRRPDIDNSLKVANDGRNVSLDERMANLEEPLDGGRIGMVAGEIMRIHADTDHSTYRDQAGVVSPVPGGLQIVFCDRSTPHQKEGKFSLYEGLRDELVERGMAAEAIRFIHDYPKPGRRRSCSRTAGLVGCRCWWGPRRKWAPAPTSRTGRWRCTTWMCRGARRTWSSGRAASCARETTGQNVNQIARLLNGGDGVGRGAEEALAATTAALGKLDPLVEWMTRASGFGEA